MGKWFWIGATIGLVAGCAPVAGIVALNDIMALTEKWKVEQEIRAERAMAEEPVQRPDRLVP